MGRTSQPEQEQLDYGVSCLRHNMNNNSQQHEQSPANLASPQKMRIHKHGYQHSKPKLPDLLLAAQSPKETQRARHVNSSAPQTKGAH